MHMIHSRGHSRHQIRRPNLVGTRRSLPKRDLRGLFLSIVAPLKCRPDPRWLWDDVARETPRSPFPWDGLQAAIRGAIIAGADRQAVVRFYSVLMEEALDELALRDGQSATLALAALFREESEAMEAQAMATARPTDENCARAVTETRESIAHAERFIAGMSDRKLELLR